MGEEETKEEKKEEVQEEPEKGVETTPLIDAANQAADRLKAENERLEKNMAKQEKMQAEAALGGESEAGQEVKKEPTDKEYKDQVMAGEVGE